MPPSFTKRDLALESLALVRSLLLGTKEDFIAILTNRSNNEIISLMAATANLTGRILIDGLGSVEAAIQFLDAAIPEVLGALEEDEDE